MAWKAIWAAKATVKFPVEDILGSTPITNHSALEPNASIAIVEAISSLRITGSRDNFSSFDHRLPSPQQDGGTTPEHERQQSIRGHAGPGRTAPGVQRN